MSKALVNRVGEKLPVMCNDEEEVKGSKGQRRHCEEIHGAVLCAFAALLWASSVGMAQVGAGRPPNPGVVPQARVDPHAIIMPVIDGKDLHFTRLSTEDGLSQTRVIQIVQDDQGFMWFGSQYGLNRYDGYNFKVLNHETGRANSLGGVYIYYLFKDRSGKLWISVDEVLDKFDPITETFTHYRIGKQDAPGGVDPITHISQDDAGRLWLATSRGLYRFDPSSGKTISYQHDPNDPLSLSSSDIKSTGEDREGTFWVANGEGVDAFNRTTGKVTLHIPLREPGEMSFHEDRSGLLWIAHVSGDGIAVYDRKTTTLTSFSFHRSHVPGSPPAGAVSILEDRDGTLWFATIGDGVLKFDRERRGFIRYRNDPTDPGSLAEDAVDTLFQDREGNIWVGLHMLSPNRFSTKPQAFETFKHVPGNPNSLSGTMVNGIYEDRNGILWISAIDALNRIDRKLGRYTFYLTAKQGTYSDPLAIIQDRSGFLWIGTEYRGLIRMDPQTGQLKTFLHSPADPFSLSNDIVMRMAIDHTGTLWAATYDGLDRLDEATSRFTVYKGDKQGAGHSYIEIKEDREGKLWLGTHDSGLQHFDPLTEQFTVYRHDSDDPTSLSNDRVNSVYFDHTGGMWVGTQNGLGKFSPITSRFKNYYDQEGIASNVVSCILEDGRGNLWMSTNKGLSVFDPSRQSFKNYSSGDGLPGADLTGWNTCFKSANGEMFFGGFSGGVAFYPDKVVENTYLPPIVLTDFRILDHPAAVGPDSVLHKSIGYTDTLTLSHEQNIFSLEFSALSFSNPATNRYRYRLDGLDHQWHEIASNQRLVTYTTLPTGDYTFHVQGATSRGTWNEPGLLLHIQILPPWWSTWWFRSLYVICFVLLLGGAYSLRIQQVRHEEKQLRNVVETIPTMSFSAWPDGTTEFVNRPWLDYTGLPEIADLSSGWASTVHSGDLDEHTRKWKASLKTGMPFENEERHGDATGEYRWFLVRVVPLRDSRGHVLKWYGTLTDIEDRKRSEEERERFRQLEAELAHINRVTTMGELTASLAHEIRQPVTAAVNYAVSCRRWLSHAVPDLEQAREAASKIVENLKSTDNIISRIRVLFHKGMPQREEVDSNEVLRDIILLMQNAASQHSIFIRTQAKENLPRVMADRVQLQQVFMNLMVNGIEAMKGTRPPRELTIESRVENGELIFSVSDTGVGFLTEDIDQIFKAFYTTKPDGTGMGLAISRSIIEAHGGRLWATANSGSGATFHITLPTET